MHVPVHAPAEQVELVQAIGALHVPVEVHVSTPPTPPSPVEHCVARGVHEPAHAPAMHAWPVHVATGELETRSGPQLTTVALLPQTVAPGVCPVHRGSMDAHVP